MTYVWQTLITVAQLFLSFYGFWLVWQVLLPQLPPPKDGDARISPYADYLISPILQPLARKLHVRPWVISFLLLSVVAASKVVLSHLSNAL
jgi:hypothetical protein